jgi:hypothetical protein
MEFPLSRAPEPFFDEHLWQIFASYFETPEIALERVGYPPGLTGYHDERYETRFSLSKEGWQEKFLSEELIATGVPRGRSRPTRGRIPMSEWKHL